MKKAFTMLELVFVIVIIGILAVVAMPSFQRDTLQEAGNQIISHIRYTQHLAMMDDKFNPADATWFKTRWQIDFRDPNANNVYYTIYQDLDKSGGPSTNIHKGEIAKNPNNPKQMLTALATGASATSKNSPQMQLNKKFGISSITFSPSCSYRNSQKLSFDYMGRPLYGNPSSLGYTSGGTPINNPYLDNGGHTGARLIKTQCKITFSTGSDSMIIAIEPETGYAHILN